MVKSTPNTQIDWQSVLSSIPNYWLLTPTKAKRPLRDGWQTEAKIPRQELLRLLKEGQWLNKRNPKPGESTEWHCRWDGIGLRTGVISGGLVALDQDGPSAIPKILELSGGEELPKTVAFSSGREGRSQYLFRVPEEYWSAIETKKYKTGVKGDDGEIEQVELRWNGCQSVLPPSAHPLTEGYHYLPGCAPWECEIAVAPAWIIERMLCESSKPEPTPHTSQPKRHSTSSTYQTNDRWTDEQWAISYLDALSSSRADDYDEWLAVGMGLHSVSDSLLSKWDAWSQQSSKYKSGDCEKKWKSFGSSGVSIASLGHMAKQDGWSSPFQKKEEYPQQQEPKQEFHPKTIAELKKINLVEAIGEHINLEKRGKHFVALCPFHAEVTPSFSISPINNLYNCSGCSDSGNILKFFTKLGARKHSFSDVVLDLSRRYQIEALSGDGVKIPLPEAPLTFPKRNSSGGNGSMIQASLRDRILEIYKRSDSEAEYQEAILDLIKSSGHSPQGVEKLRKTIESDLDFDLEKVEASAGLSNLLKNHAQELNPSHYLWGDRGRLALAMSTTAAAMPTAVAFIFSSFIAASGSRIGTSSRVIIKPSGKYKQPCIFWIAVVARSGKLKTPAQLIAVDPLTTLEIESKKAYEASLKTYEKEIKHCRENNLEPPNAPEPRKRYMTKDATLESLERIHAGNPRGILYYRDELAGMFKSQNVFKPSGRGADQEAELDQWNGTPSIVDRKERENCLGRTAISRTGSIQYEVLQKHAGDHEDYNGSLARWLFCAVKAPDRYIDFNDEPDTGISELLEALYRNLELLPERDYLIDKDAQAAFKVWQHSLVDLEKAESHPGLQLVYPKIEAYTTRLALWLHCVNATLAGELPAPSIPGTTMAKAIDLASFFLGQAKLVYAVNSPQSGLTGRLLKLYQFAEGKIQGVTPSSIKANSRTFRGTSTSDILRDCQTLVNDGYFRQSGKEFFVIDKIDKIDTVSINLSMAETPACEASQAFIDKIDKIDATVNGTLATPSPKDTGVTPSQPSIESVNFVNLSTNSIETLANSSVDNIDKNIDTASIGVNIVNLTPTLAVEMNSEDDMVEDVTDEWLDSFEDMFEERAQKALDAENGNQHPVAPAAKARETDADIYKKPEAYNPYATGALTPASEQKKTEAITPSHSPQPALLSSAGASASSEPTEIKVGDPVALADPYAVAYSYHGIVEDNRQGKVLVRWAERQGKPNECETYSVSELRRVL